MRAVWHAQTRYVAGPAQDAGASVGRPCSAYTGRPTGHRENVMLGRSLAVAVRRGLFAASLMGQEIPPPAQAPRSASTHG